MEKDNFVEFLLDIGFGKVRMPGSYSINSDIIGEVNSNFRSYVKPITINISGDRITVSISEIGSFIIGGKNLFYYNLSSFTEDDKITLIEYLLPFFNKVPDKFKPYLRDNKINSILK